jgi:hypothetical protein
MKAFADMQLHDLCSARVDGFVCLRLLDFAYSLLNQMIICGAADVLLLL